MNKYGRQLKIQLLYGILHHHQRTQHYNNTSTACDTLSIKVDITDIRNHSVNFQSFFLFWIACDTPSIKVDTTEQQVARHNQPNVYMHTTTRQQNILISTTSGETFNTIYKTNQKNTSNQVHLGPIYNLRPHMYYPPDYFGYYFKYVKWLHNNSSTMILQPAC